MYFLFTTISTVGLGDYHPETDLERAASVVCMVLGLITATYLVSAVTQNQREKQDFEGELSLFLSLLLKFNPNQSLKSEDKLRAFF